MKRLLPAGAPRIFRLNRRRDGVEQPRPEEPLFNSHARGGVDYDSRHSREARRADTFWLAGVF